MRSALLFILALALSWLPGAARAHDSCKLTSTQKVRAVKAFKALSPIFQDPRCVNCHGAVNPFIVDGGHPYFIDIVEEAKKFLAQPDPAANLVESSGPRSAAELSGIQEIASSTEPVSDIDVIRRKALKPMNLRCAECHFDNWFLPMRENHFAGRSWKQICTHLKTSRITSTPARFKKHMEEDPQVLLGVEGHRGLLDPPDAQPPAMPYETMIKHASDWLAAMDGHFYPPAECGCESEGLALEIRHRVHTNPESGSSKAGDAQFDGTVVFGVMLEEIADGWFRKDNIAVRREVDVKHTRPSFWDCAGKGVQDEDWSVSARLDETGQSMEVRFDFVVDASEASWTCKARGQTITEEAFINLSSHIESLTMPTADGAVGQASGAFPKGQTDQRLVKQFESISISLVDLPRSQN